MILNLNIVESQDKIFFLTPYLIRFIKIFTILNLNTVETHCLLGIFGKSL